MLPSFGAVLLLATGVAATTCPHSKNGNCLLVVQPSSLADQYSSTAGEISETSALFGIPPYGNSLSGPLLYLHSEQHDACKPIDMTKVANPPDREDTFILMVDRGDCTFVTKVRHGQDIGANGVIIVDNKDEPRIPFMADDGTGGSITIPSMLIHKNDGIKINNTLNAATDNDVFLEMVWGLPRPDNKVEWTLWTSSNDALSKNFKENFKSAYDALEDAESHEFAPHYFTINLQRYSAAARDSYCINHGRYCAQDPEKDPNRGVDGSDVVEENLRQMCIWEIANSSSCSAAGDQPDMWWDYLNRFELHCSTDETTWTLACSEQQMDEAEAVQARAGTPLLGGTLKSQVATCVANSYCPDGQTGCGKGPTDDVTNTKFEAERSLMREMGIWLLPTVMINNVKYLGSLDCPNPIELGTCGVLKTICSGYKDRTLIPACNGDAGCPVGEKRDECNVCGGPGRDACGTCNVPANQSCADCEGVPNGPKKADCSGACLLPTDSSFKMMDDCNRCLLKNSNLWNKACVGCDGTINSGKTRDACGECGGSITDPSQCPAASKGGGGGGDGVSTGGVIGIVIASSFILCGLGYWYLRQQKTQWNHQLKDILKQYEPLGNDNKELDNELVAPNGNSVHQGLQPVSSEGVGVGGLNNNERV